MPTRVLTSIQSKNVAKCLTALAVTLNELGFPWPAESRSDLERAYEAIGVPMPLKFEVRPAAAPAIEVAANETVQ